MAWNELGKSPEGLRSVLTVRTSSSPSASKQRAPYSSLPLHKCVCKDGAVAGQWSVAGQVQTHCKSSAKVLVLTEEF